MTYNAQSCSELLWRLILCFITLALAVEEKAWALKSDRVERVLPVCKHFRRVYAFTLTAAF